MIRFEAEVEENFLRVTLSGMILPGALARCEDELRAALALLQPGFRVMTDLSEVSSLHAGCAVEMQHFMDELARAGVAEVMRVITDRRCDIGFAIMSAFHYPSRVRIRTFERREDALAHLARTGRVRA